MGSSTDRRPIWTARPTSIDTMPFVALHSPAGTNRVSVSAPLCPTRQSWRYTRTDAASARVA